MRVSVEFPLEQDFAAGDGTAFLKFVNELGQVLELGLTGLAVKVSDEADTDRIVIRSN